MLISSHLEGIVDFFPGLLYEPLTAVTRYILVKRKLKNRR